MMHSTLTCNNCGAANQPQAAYCRSCGSSLQAVKPTLYNSATGRLLANITLKQRYRIIAPVGKGGMGAVYKAEDTQLGNRQVALKEMSQSGLSPQEQKEAADAFRQEALMLARLQHPNLPNIFDHFEENGRWYLVMSFIEGETLEDYFSHAQGGKLPLDEALQIGMQLCTVLSYLHTRQPAIIFRDLKPANIMRMPDGHTYLIDFGIARHFKPGQAKDTAYYGSMGYAPPEQYGKAQTTPRSDIYSLGAMLYQLISGHNPSSSPFRFPLLSSLVPTAPADLTALLTRMLELDEDKRPASMLLVKQELHALASPPTPKPSMPAPSPASLAPTQLAKPAPGSLPAAPTQLAIKPVGVWAFGKRQLVTMLILAGCYGVILCLNPLVLYRISAHSTFVLNFEEGFLPLLAIFFASFFGPWVGIGATGIGFLLADLIEYLVRDTGRYPLPFWWVAPLLMLSAFLAGLFLLKTQGQYGKFGNILFAWLLGLLDVCLYIVLLNFTDSVVQNIPFLLFLRYSYPLYQISSSFILLPLLLFFSDRIRSAWERRRIQRHP